MSRLKAALKLSIDNSGLSREQVVDRMNRAAAAEGLGNGRGRRITTAALDGWLAQAKGNMIPVDLLPIFCWATGSLEPLRVLAACNEAEVISREEGTLLAMAKVDREMRRLQKKRRQLSVMLEEGDALG